jgi:hypothetical protein
MPHIPEKIATIECATCGAFIEVYHQQVEGQDCVNWTVRDAELCRDPSIHRCRQVCPESGGGSRTTSRVKPRCSWPECYIALQRREIPRSGSVGRPSPVGRLDRCSDLWSPPPPRLVYLRQQFDSSAFCSQRGARARARISALAPHSVYQRADRIERRELQAAPLCAPRARPRPLLLRLSA